MTIKEKASYIKGLIEGLELDKGKKENKLFYAMADLLEDISDSVTQLEDEYDDVCDQLDVLDEDLATVEDKIEECSAHSCDCDCEEVFYDVTCPKCKEKVCLTDSTLSKGSIDCPSCGEFLEFDPEEICACNCDDNHGCSDNLEN